ncbi:two component transcriptional regulator, LuxR family [Anaerocolumna jejuensis DSM 15929]|uniref:Stage 0 sporulation protein A homolog n=1 Tax=Anaerocolumna jejuensis DSM 15929 TaxID=1121322 RepID=A0A1M6PN76_9FIRM|nr:response regulator transcription factor [Anaerocolumna jejuensis]SHK09338.1 two component transcriptional regulator, LuxR family [Anaerocolumna jejuensis DSM 15929]
MADRIRVIIADDSDFVRDGMRIILSVDEEFLVTGCAADGREAVEAARRNPTDVVLMDIQMPVMDGIEATGIIVKENLAKVLILTTFDDYDLVREAMKNGAKGYLIKNHTPDQLKQMIKSIHNGAGVMEESILTRLTQADNSIMGAKGFPRELYTDREMEIIRAVSEGLSNKEIAEKLFLSEGTVKNYISNILEKEGISHRTQLAVYYLTGKRG